MRESSENLAACLVPSFVCVQEQAGYFAAAKERAESRLSEINCWAVQDRARVCWGLQKGQGIINHLIISHFSLQSVSGGVRLILLWVVLLHWCGKVKQGLVPILSALLLLCCIPPLSRSWHLHNTWGETVHPGWISMRQRTEIEHQEERQIHSKEMGDGKYERELCTSWFWGSWLYMWQKTLGPPN